MLPNINYTLDLTHDVPHVFRISLHMKKPPLKLKFNYLENNKDLVIYGSMIHDIPSEKCNQLMRKGNPSIIVINPAEPEAQ